MYCRKCGWKMPLDSVFCMKCGTKVEYLDEVPEADEVLETDEVPETDEMPALDETLETDEMQQTEKIPPILDEIRRRDMEDATVSQSENSTSWGTGIVLVIVAMVVILIMGIMMIVMQPKLCDIDSCEEERAPGSDYCEYHICDVEGCTYSASNGSYCFSHSCLDIYCSRLRVEGGSYCSSHTCSKSGCKNGLAYKSIYCKEHYVVIDMRKKLDADFSISVNSAGGVNLNFKSKNISGKTIKYIRFYATLKNAVGDRIREEITNDYEVYVEVIGPIENGERASFYKIIGYNEDCARLDIDDITIVYSDGTSETGHFGWYTTK